MDGCILVRCPNTALPFLSQVLASLCRSFHICFSDGAADTDAPDGDRKTWSAQLQTWSEQLTDLQRSVAKAFGYEDPVPEPTPLRKRDRLFNWFGGSA